jgi:hypothetical protein
LFKLHDSDVEGGGVGIYVSDPTNLTLEDIHVRSGDVATGDSIAIYASNGTVNLLRVQAFAGASPNGTSYGFFFTKTNTVAFARFTDSQIYGGDPLLGVANSNTGLHVTSSDTNQDIECTNSTFTAVATTQPGRNSIGVRSNPFSPLTATNCTFRSGAVSGVAESTALATGRGTISGGSIESGAVSGGAISRAAGGGFTLTNVMITSGPALDASDSVAVDVSGNPITNLVRCQVTAGSVADGDSIGVRFTTTGAATSERYDGNVIDAGPVFGAGTATGVFGRPGTTNATFELVSNLIFATRGIDLALVSGIPVVVLSNNTVIATETAVKLGLDQARLANNIFVGRFGVVEDSVAADPGSLQSNLFVDATGDDTGIAYADYTGTGGGCPSDPTRNCFNTGATLTQANTTQGSGTVAGNLVYELAGVGFDVNYALTGTTPDEISKGGMNTAQSACGPSPANLSCGNVTADADGGAARSCPTPVTACYSMGAYEYEGP